MPVICSARIPPLNQEEFHALDKKVMKHAFEIHNQLGRFFDEGVCRTELVRRCVADGLDVKREGMICTEHETSREKYFF